MGPQEQAAGCFRAAEMAKSLYTTLFISMRLAGPVGNGGDAQFRGIVSPLWKRIFFAL